MKKIKKIKIYINNDKKSKMVAEKLKNDLLKYHFEITDSDYDLAISVGGDGSFLRMIKDNNFNNEIYYIGVNSGTLGFLQEIDIKDTTNFVKRLYDGDYKIEKLSYEEETLFCKNNCYHLHSLNEIVIRKKDFSILNADVLIDNELLENFSGDGLLISTSTGSTAYNMSFNGPIVYNTLASLVVTPIAPLNNKVYTSLTNPLIVPNNKIITIIPKGKSLFLMIDGEIKESDNVDKIVIKISNKKIHCLRMNNYHFIKIVNNKILKK